MPLVFVHGVATRSSSEYPATVAQRDQLFHSLTFQLPNFAIFNPLWGSFGVQFGEDLPWLPKPTGNQTFAVGGGGDGVATDTPDSTVPLGKIAGQDAEQAVDLVAMAALELAIQKAVELDLPAAAATDEAIGLAKAAGAYLERKGVVSKTERTGIPALAVAKNDDFADALKIEIDEPGLPIQAYGLGDTIRSAIAHLGGMVGNGASDLLLRAVRRSASRGVSLFIGDVFVYLRGRDIAGAEGTRERIFKPIIDDLVAAATLPRPEGEPLVVVGHSLGGVILYDILTDAVASAEIEARLDKPLSIDAFFTVGSQPGFFADLGLYAGGRPTAGTKLPKPMAVGSWMNVFDYTDIFSFRSDYIFEGVEDFGYDTVTDLVHAHTAYFLRPSFYKRMRARLQALGKI